MDRKNDIRATYFSTHIFCLLSTNVSNILTTPISYNFSTSFSFNFRTANSFIFSTLFSLSFSSHIFHSYFLIFSHISVLFSVSTHSHIFSIDISLHLPSTLPLLTVLSLLPFHYFLHPMTHIFCNFSIHIY